MSFSSRINRLCLALTGQDALVVYHQLQAIYYNSLTWLLVLLRLRKVSDTLEPTAFLLPPCADSSAVAAPVLSPGGLERLFLEPLGTKVATVGYNVKTCTSHCNCG